MNPKELRPGEVFRGKTGEILEFIEIADSEVCFRVLDPGSLRPTDFFLYGPVRNFSGFYNAIGLHKIDLKTFKPMGLVKQMADDVNC